MTSTQRCLFVAEMFVLFYLFLTERLDGGGIVQQLSPDHRLHVEDLAAQALHQHREEVWVGEVQSALRGRSKTYTVKCKCVNDYATCV